MPITGPYDFASSINFYKRSRFESVAGYSDADFVRTMNTDDGPVIIQVPANQADSIRRFSIAWRAPYHLTKIEALRRRLTRMFYLDFDLESFYRSRLDSIMHKLIRRFSGFRLVLTADIFEAAAWAIIGQQVNLRFACSIKDRLSQVAGGQFSVNGRTFRLFPTASAIAGLEMKSLKSMQLSQRKAEYLRDFSHLVSTGELDLDGLTKADADTAAASLQRIRGIGPWSANYILMRGSGHPDAFPFGDSGINRAVMTHYRLAAYPDEKYLRKLSEKWRPYRSLAAFYLWKSLSEIK